MPKTFGEYILASTNQSDQNLNAILIISQALGDLRDGIVRFSYFLINSSGYKIVINLWKKTSLFTMLVFKKSCP